VAFQCEGEESMEPEAGGLCDGGEVAFHVDRVG